MIERLGFRVMAVGIAALGVVIVAYLTSWFVVWAVAYAAAVAYLRDRRVTIVRLRLQVYLDRRDVWFGCYVAPQAVFVCPAPCVVFRFARRPAMIPTPVRPDVPERRP